MIGQIVPSQGKARSSTVHASHSQVKSSSLLLILPSSHRLASPLRYLSGFHRFSITSSSLPIFALTNHSPRPRLFHRPLSRLHPLYPFASCSSRINECDPLLVPVIFLALLPNDESVSAEQRVEKQDSWHKHNESREERSKSTRLSKDGVGHYERIIGLHLVEDGELDIVVASCMDR